MAGACDADDHRLRRDRVSQGSATTIIVWDMIVRPISRGAKYRALVQILALVRYIIGVKILHDASLLTRDGYLRRLWYSALDSLRLSNLRILPAPENVSEGVLSQNHQKWLR